MFRAFDGFLSDFGVTRDFASSGVCGEVAGRIRAEAEAASARRKYCHSGSRPTPCGFVSHGSDLVMSMASGTYPNTKLTAGKAGEQQARCQLGLLIHEIKYR